MPLIPGMTGEPAEPDPYRRRQAGVPAALPEMLADSRFDPAEAPPPQRTWSPPVTSFSMAGLLDRPPVYVALDRWDAALAESWQAHEGKVEPLREVVMQLEQIDGDERRERREHDRLMRKAVVEGKTPPKLKPTDWSARRAQLESEQRARLDLARESYRQYGDMAKARMPAVQDRVAAEIESRRAEAVQAWTAAEQALRGWRSAVWLCDEIARRVDPERDRLAARMGAHAQQVLGDGMRALPAVGALLDSDDAVLSGSRHLQADGLEVPLHTRRAWLEGSAREVAELAALEHSEGYAITSLTRATHEHRFAPRAQ